MRIEINEYGDTCYYNDQNEFHLLDGPAIEWSDGSKSWYLHGVLHREDGPAVEDADGTKIWCINDKCHREDGPAVIWPNGSKWWFINGEELSEEEFRHRTNRTCKLPDYLK